LIRDASEVWPSPADEPAHGLFMKAWRMCRERLSYLEKTVALQEGLPADRVVAPEAVHA